MNEYNHTTLALIDFELDKCVSKKEYYEKRIIQLYEARENIIADIQDTLKPICCGDCEDE